MVAGEEKLAEIMTRLDKSSKEFEHQPKANVMIVDQLSNDNNINKMVSMKC